MQFRGSSIYDFVQKPTCEGLLRQESLEECVLNDWSPRRRKDIQTVFSDILDFLGKTRKTNIAKVVRKYDLLFGMLRVSAARNNSNSALKDDVIFQANQKNPAYVRLWQRLRFLSIFIALSLSLGEESCIWTMMNVSYQRLVLEEVRFC